MIWAWIERLFEEHKFVRRILVLWAIALITFVVISMSGKIDTVDAAAASFGATVVGILATVIGFYIKSRELDEKKDAPDP